MARPLSIEYPGGLQAVTEKQRQVGAANGGEQAVLLIQDGVLARIFHELLAATTDMVILPGVLGCRPLRRTVQVRLGTNSLRLPGGTPIFVVSRQQFMKYPG
ncbi:MAG: hypothetical protein V3W07_07820 [Syntrophobacteria bacterium]